MLVNIYLDPDGAEALAKGNSLYPHNLSLHFENPVFPLGKNKILIGTAEVTLPTVDGARLVAVQHLQEELQTMRASFGKSEVAMTGRIQNLLAIEGPRATGDEDDIPF